MASAEDFLTGELPQWRSSGPTGGYIASELKKIHDDSMSVFPESVYSAEGPRRQARWKSTMMSDFIPIEQLQAQAEMRKFGVKAHMGNAPEDDCGVAGTFGAGVNSMFQSWKVPSRLTESDERSGTRASIRSVAKELSDLRIESARERSALPQINGTIKGRCSAAQSVINIRPASKLGQPKKKPKSLATKMLFDQYHPRPEKMKPASRLSQVPDLDIKMMEQGVNIGQPKKLNEVDAPVKKWLEEASPKEREVALAFFNSLAGTQLMGGTNEKKERVDQVVSLLKNPPNKYAMDQGDAPTDGIRRLRHINILSPTVRQNKWRHQTWHNLPSYPNRNKVLNKSSILVEPHGTVPRHFTIHPDWGP